MQTTEVDAAIADFTKAAQIAPSPFALYWLGRALESKGNTQQAAKAYAAALQLAPAMGEARTRLEALQPGTQ
jgi:tetratricopeptide (TPR) repeat protein